MNPVLPRSRISWLISLLSLLIMAVVAVLVTPEEPLAPHLTLDVSRLPALNALLNGSVAILLCLGYILIRLDRMRSHQVTMLSAFVLSALFLVSYVVLHSVAGATEFTRTGWIRPAYYTVLVSHIILSMVVLPLALMTLYRGWTDAYGDHRRLARYTLPIWLYTSISGVLVYLILYRWPV